MGQTPVKRCGSGIRIGFTIIELLVVISIIAVLISILLPSVRLARRTSIELVCATRLRSVSHVQLMYQVDNNRLPLHVSETSGHSWNTPNTIAADRQRHDMRPLYEAYIHNLDGVFNCPFVPKWKISGGSPAWLGLNYMLGPGYFGDGSGGASGQFKNAWTKTAFKPRYDGYEIDILAADLMRFISHGGYSWLGMRWDNVYPHGYGDGWYVFNSTHTSHQSVQRMAVFFEDRRTGYSANYIYSDGSLFTYRPGDNNWLSVPRRNTPRDDYLLPKR